MNRQAALDAIAAHLLNDAVAHELARFDEIGRRFDAVERTLPVDDTVQPNLAIALLFWDGWIDARNRGWQASRSIQQHEWPLLARDVAADLLADRAIQDARVLALFDTAASTGSSDRVRTVAARLRARHSR